VIVAPAYSRRHSRSGRKTTAGLLEDPIWAPWKRPGAQPARFHPRAGAACWSTARRHSDDPRRGSWPRRARRRSGRCRAGWPGGCVAASCQRDRAGQGRHGDRPRLGQTSRVDAARQAVARIVSTAQKPCRRRPAPTLSTRSPMRQSASTPASRLRPAAALSTTPRRSRSRRRPALDADHRNAAFPPLSSPSGVREVAVDIGRRSPVAGRQSVASRRAPASVARVSGCNCTCAKQRPRAPRPASAPVDAHIAATAIKLPQSGYREVERREHRPTQAVLAKRDVIDRGHGWSGPAAPT